MKRYLAFILILELFSLKSIAQTDVADVRLNQLRNEVLINLTQNILPYWSTRMVDNKNGGFYGRIDANDRVYPNEDKGGILNARILWTYSAAYRILKDTAYLRIATRAKNYILAHFIDKIYGGAYRSLRADGEPADTRKQTYTQSFFIYGLSEYYRVTGDKEALKTAIEIFEHLEEFALDTTSDGYFEVYSRDWKRSHDLLIGEKTINDEKTMNTHLHLMEAYTNLYRVWPDKRAGDRLRNLVELFLNKIVDPGTSHLICFLDRKWNRTSDVNSYGHDIESSWLLPEAAGVLGDPALLAKVRETSNKIAAAASEGLQPDGSMIYEKDLITGHTDTERSWWVQAETIIGYLNAWQMTGNPKYLNNAINCWNYTKNHLVDYKSGGWFSTISASGVPGTGDKAGFWVCPYHNGRMCMELSERIPANNK